MGWHILGYDCTGTNGDVVANGDGANYCSLGTKYAVISELGMAADVGLMDDEPKKIALAIRIAKKCMRIVYENIWFAIGVKVICLVLGALGIASMWLAIFADVGVMVLAVLNAIRAMFTKNLRV